MSVFTTIFHGENLTVACNLLVLKIDVIFDLFSVFLLRASLRLHLSGVADPVR